MAASPNGRACSERHVQRRPRASLAPLIVEWPMAKVLFDIAHPKHFYQFRFAMADLARDHAVHVIAREKDVLLTLLSDSEIKFHCYGRSRSGLTGKLVQTP